MSKLSEFLTNIANAIRNLKGTSEPINAQNFATEINDMKEALDDTTATPEDIVLGKTAFVKGQKVVGTYKNPTSLKALLDYTRSCSYMFYGNKNITDLTRYIAYEDTSNVTNMDSMFSGCKVLTTIPPLDTSKVTNTNMMFYGCNSLNAIPPLNTSNVTKMFRMFYGCSSLTTIPQLNTSNVTDMSNMFNNCNSLTTIQSLDASKVTNMSYMFGYCNSLTTIPPLDTRNVTNMDMMFYGCQKLTNLTLLNIKRNLQVGSGSSWGHLLTLESLLGLCQECINVNSSRTLTVGTANMNKLANVYVKLTNEPEEDETLPKIPMAQCESTDEGAMTIDAYMALKNWKIA